MNLSPTDIARINADCRMVCAEPMPYQVIVSNVGTVYEGYSSTEAQAAYAEYKAASIDAIGRAAGEDVTLFVKGDPAQEFTGALSDHRAAMGDDSDEDVPEVCDCPGCRLARAGAMLMLIRQSDGQ